MTATALSIMSSMIETQCDEQIRLRRHLASAIRSLVKTQTCYLDARRAGDSAVSRFENDLRTAGEEWKLARKSYLDHRAAHGCCDCVFVGKDVEDSQA